MTRTMDVRHINTVANHPDVRPFLGGDGPLDLTAVVSDPQNFAFVTDHGAVLWWALGAGRYDVHTLFLPEGRGAESLQALRDVAHFMFTRTDCIEARTTVPTENRAAAVAARRAGCQPLFATRIPWTNGARVEAEVFSLSLDRWALTSPATLAAGHAFHDQLTAAKEAAGSALPVHDDDPIHDRMVGAATLMAVGGQPEKAVRAYNAWAVGVGYQPISLLSTRPVVVDVVDAIVTCEGGRMEMLLCRQAS